MPAIPWQNRPTFQQVVQLPVGLCGRTPATACRRPTSPLRAQLQLRVRPLDTLDRLAWKWTHGAATAIGDFGEPRIDTSYDLCIYDATGLVSRSTVPAGGLCRGNSCWRGTSTGFTYANREPGPRGLQKLVLRAGSDGKAKILAKGKGAGLDMPSLPVTQLPVRVQLVGTGGACWEATFDTTLQNLPDRFKAEND